MQRRNLLLGTTALAIGAAGSGKVFAQQPAAAAGEFDIDAEFEKFMQGAGGSADDGGGPVRFTGRDPFIQSRFRTGARMAIPAMGAAVGAAAVWV